MQNISIRTTPIQGKFFLFFFRCYCDVFHTIIWINKTQLMSIIWFFSRFNFSDSVHRCVFWINSFVYQIFSIMIVESLKNFCESIMNRILWPMICLSSTQIHTAVQFCDVKLSKFHFHLSFHSIRQFCFSHSTFSCLFETLIQHWKFIKWNLS